MPCANCGHDHDHRNPLDSCSRSFDACQNPCGVGPKNTAKCESLPSQIQNFTLQFFGTVVKTEVDGLVTWSLPCGLDVGLPNNPRGIDEGLACYFLRLFHDGIVGLTGPQGAPGANGANGNNAFTVTLRGFTQPTIASPIVQVVTQFNPAIIAGIYVYITNSGWYQILETDGNGTLLLALVKSADSPANFIVAGKLVVPSGFPGASIQGGPGPQGPQGPQGGPGEDFTKTNGQFFTQVGVDFSLPITYTQIDYANAAPAVTLPAAGTYLVTVNVGFAGSGSVAVTDEASFKLFNLNLSADIPGSEQSMTGLSAAGQKRTIAISVQVQTDAPNQTVALFGKGSNASVFTATALRTTITYTRIS